MTEDAMPHRARSFVAGLTCALLLPSFAASDAAAETIRGRVDRFDRIHCPHGNCETLTFEIRMDGGGLVRVDIQERVIEGTVFVGHTVMVEGSWRDRATKTQFHAQRVTDVTTLATFGDGDRASSLKYREGEQMTFTGVIDNLQPLEQPSPGQRQKMQSRRFLLLVTTPSGAGTISVERVAPTVRDLLSDNDEVVIVGEWTKRNVLRAETITRK